MLAVVVVVTVAPAISAGFPHLSTFGWTLITAGYLTYFGVVAELVVVYRPGRGDRITAAEDEHRAKHDSGVAA